MLISGKLALGLSLAAWCVLSIGGVLTQILTSHTVAPRAVMSPYTFTMSIVMVGTAGIALTALIVSVVSLARNPRSRRTWLALALSGLLLTPLVGLWLRGGA